MYVYVCRGGIRNEVCANYYVTPNCRANGKGMLTANSVLGQDNYSIPTDRFTHSHL